jgi:hypothetical protein
MLPYIPYVDPMGMSRLSWKCLVGWSGASHFRTCGVRSRRLCTRSRMRSSGKKTTSVSHDVLLEADDRWFWRLKIWQNNSFSWIPLPGRWWFRQHKSNFCCFEPQTCLSCLYNINKLMVSQVLPAIIRNVVKPTADLDLRFHWAHKASITS